MLDERKAAILRVIVEEYIHTAQPVGSAHVAGVRELSVSSATVRNEMGLLEREGYLVQPHTSAGRIPTDKGYRFFVDSLSPHGTLGNGQAQQVRSFFDRAHGELERMLGDTSRLLSSLTHYAAMVTTSSHPHDPARIRSVQLVSLSPRVVLAVVVCSNGAVDKRTLEMDLEVDDAVVGAAGAHLAGQLNGIVLGMPVALAPTGDADVDRLAGAALAALVEPFGPGPDEQVFVGGAARMASAFDTIGTVRQVLSILEQQVVLVTLLRDVLNGGLSVAIGTEHGVELLADCSVVVAPYEVEGEQVGAIGVLGPTRMHYDQALAAVAVVSRRLGRALSEGA